MDKQARQKLELIRAVRTLTFPPSWIDKLLDMKKAKDKEAANMLEFERIIKGWMENGGAN